MKKTAILVLIVMVASTSLALAGTRANVGCGLGSMIFQDQSDGLISQVSAATTNGTFGNQTFGISSGTLGCEQFTTMAMSEKLEIFVADNMDNVAVDIAAGQGEALEAIAEIAVVPQSQRALLYATLQSNFSVIYPDATVTHQEVSGAIDSIIAQM